MVSDSKSSALVVFALGELHFALSMAVIERVVRAVEVAPMPDPPPGVIGVVNVHGRIIPVFDIRPRFGLATRQMEVSDHFVIAHAGDRDVAILVDAAVDVVSAENVKTAELAVDTLAGLGTVEGVMLHGDEVVPIQDLSRFLPPELSRSPALKLAA